jgi:hypothetical protein
MNNKELYKEFEYHCCIIHQNNFNQVTIHWQFLSDVIIIACNFENSFENLRLKREKNIKKYGDDYYYNPLREYGIYSI